MLDTYLRASNAQTLVYRQPWLVSVLTMDCRKCITTSKPLLPTFYHDPMTKKRAASTRCPAAQISALEGDSAEIAGTIGKKPSIGKSSVHLNYHMNLEYHELAAGQKRELSEWRKSNPNFKCIKSGKSTRSKSKGCPNNKFPNSKQISSLFPRISRRL